VAATITQRLTTVDSRPVRAPAPSPTWTPAARTLGVWSAIATSALLFMYVPVVIAAFISQGNMTDPIGDPFLAALEVLIVLVAIPMVLLMASVHAFARAEARPLSMAAFSFMVVLAGITTAVHFVLLTVDRQVNLSAYPGYSSYFSWEWPSVMYALDIIAWDWFLGVSLLLAAPVFAGDPPVQTWLRRAMVVSGAMCIAGLVGPLTDHIGLRLIGELGYWFGFPVVTVLMAIAFARTEPAR
jgi:hypothetical protein